MLYELLPEDINLGVVRERRRGEVMNDAFAGCDEGLTIDELYESVRKLKNHKAPGPDRIQGEIVKSIYGQVKEVLLNNLNELW